MAFAIIIFMVHIIAGKTYLIVVTCCVLIGNNLRF